MTEKKLPKLGLVDPSSYANPEKIKVTHIELFLKIDFTLNILTGKVHLKCQKKENVKTNHLILDTNSLNILNVTNLLNQKPLEFDIGEHVEFFGSPLCVTLPGTEGENNIFNICIEYETSQSASGLQWLTPEQTMGKQAPFMFSHCQPIHCRSIIPCQDTPTVKCPYKAEIIAPKNLIVLMSAARTEDPIAIEKTKLLWKFEQNNPIPSYLIAIAAGRLKERILGMRTKVYAEPEIIKECAYEFAETEAMIKVAVKLCGPYVWGRFDLLVLPPCFPFVGMENPCLTFLTPTILTGDRSMVHVIAHEIAHSWVGNSVTSKNFEHIWLSEGLTAFIERKIIGVLFGEEHRHLQALLGLASLREAVTRTLGEKHAFTCLVPKLTNANPDEVFSCVPREKGHTLLYILEKKMDEDGMFNKFLINYLDKFKFQTVKSDDFKNYLYEFFKEKSELLDEVDWNTWLYCPGMPPIIPEYDETLAKDINDLVEKWRHWSPSENCLFDSSPFQLSDLEGFKTSQKILYMAKLLDCEPLELGKLKLMHNIYHMDDVQNADIKCGWFRVCIKGKWKERVPAALKFVNEQGRKKFVCSIYRDLNRWGEVRQMAMENFLQNKKNMMHPVAVLVEKDFQLFRFTSI